MVCSPPIGDAARGLRIHGFPSVTRGYYCVPPVGGKTKMRVVLVSFLNLRSPVALVVCPLSGAKQ